MNKQDFARTCLDNRSQHNLASFTKLSFHLEKGNFDFALWIGLSCADFEPFMCKQNLFIFLSLSITRLSIFLKSGFSLSFTSFAK